MTKKNMEIFFSIWKNVLKKWQLMKFVRSCWLLIERVVVRTCEVMLRNDQKKKTMRQSRGFFNWRLQGTLHLKKCFSLGVWTLFPYFQIPNPETKYHRTFTILAIIKLFSINADVFFLKISHPQCWKF
jgi:hypothetical protein